MGDCSTHTKGRVNKIRLSGKMLRPVDGSKCNEAVVDEGRRWRNCHMTRHYICLPFGGLLGRVELRRRATRKKKTNDGYSPPTTQKAMRTAIFVVPGFFASDVRLQNTRCATGTQRPVSTNDIILTLLRTLLYIPGMWHVRNKILPNRYAQCTLALS